MSAHDKEYALRLLTKPAVELLALVRDILPAPIELDFDDETAVRRFLSAMHG
jgi:hypothetical protein